LPSGRSGRGDAGAPAAASNRPAILFKDREELISYSQAALARAKAAAPTWFGLLPKADVVIQPYPKFREKNGPNEYNSPAEDGSRPGIFFISAYQAEKRSKAGPESTAFHETVPGHHLQGAIALERKDIHPIGRYLSNSGYAEGWALYRRLADEMKLYHRTSTAWMLSSQALRNLPVVDTGPMRRMVVTAGDRPTCPRIQLKRTMRRGSIAHHLSRTGDHTCWASGDSIGLRGAEQKQAEIRHQGLPRPRLEDGAR
jgi:hypothetical protein